jgi:hypothetical protein
MNATRVWVRACVPETIIDVAVRNGAWLLPSTAVALDKRQTITINVAAWNWLTPLAIADRKMTRKCYCPDLGCFVS